MLNLHFLGYGAAFYPQFGNTSAWFMRDGGFYLIDCGEDVFKKVYGLLEYQKAREVTVLLTHMHTDHVGSLGELIAYSRFCRNLKVRVVYPDVRLVRFLELCGIPEEIYGRLDGLAEGNGLRAEAVPVVHDPCMGCFGYRISDPEETVYYSGDSRLVTGEVLDELRAGTLSRLYLDTSKHAPEDSGHGCYEALKREVAGTLRSRIVCMHLDCDFREEILAAGFKGAGF